MDRVIFRYTKCLGCSSLRLLHEVYFSVSGSNLANHLVGSLKKGKSLTPIPPTAYATLPSQHHASRAEPVNLSLPPAHKRSPSSDSGNPGSRSTTPVSYHLGNIIELLLHIRKVVYVLHLLSFIIFYIYLISCP